MSKPAKRLEGIGEYYFSQKLREIDELRRSGRTIINLGIGSPDLPPHPSVIAALQERSTQPDVHAYQSYKGSPALREAIAGWYLRSYQVRLDPHTEILPLIGSKEGILHICMSFLDPGDEALIPNPGYPTYRAAVQLAGAKAIEYELTAEGNWYPDIDALERTDLTKVKLMWLNYPHMPTGQKADAAVFASLIAFARRHQILLCHDNPYSFILNDTPQSILSSPGAMEVCVELNSLSKSHNMAGWRVGMLSGRQDRIETVLRFKSNMDSGMFLPLQLAAVTALQLGPDWYASLNEIYKERKEKVFQLLDLLGCRYDTEQTGLFVWALLPEGGESAYAVSDQLLQGPGVFLTPGGIFGSAGERYLRVSLCGSTERFDEAIEKIRETTLHESK